MVSIVPTGACLGATVLGLDLSQAIGAPDLGRLVMALGEFGLLRFPSQSLTPERQRAFAANFGQVQAIRGRLAVFTAPGVPEINILSNIKENGQNIGAVDAGVIWHTDMVHNVTPGFANVLYALKVPRRDGRALGGTEFYNLKAAWANLPDEMKAKLDAAVGVYSGENYTSIERQAFPEYGVNSHKASKKPAVRHPIAMTHPITGDKILYCDPGHIDRIEGLRDSDSAAMLNYLLKHIMQPKHHYVYHWTEGDVMMWDNLQTVHHAVMDYGADEHRLIWRCQVEGDKVFDAGFVASARNAAVRAANAAI